MGDSTGKGGGIGGGGGMSASGENTFGQNNVGRDVVSVVGGRYLRAVPPNNENNRTLRNQLENNAKTSATIFAAAKSKGRNEPVKMTTRRIPHTVSNDGRLTKSGSGVSFVTTIRSGKAKATVITNQSRGSGQAMTFSTISTGRGNNMRIRNNVMVSGTNGKLGTGSATRSANSFADNM